MRSRLSVLLFSLLAFVALSGNRCVFIATSGDVECKPTPDKPCEKPKPVPAGTAIAIGGGRFVGVPVEGLGYEAGAFVGVTGPEGEFDYEVGKSVRFFIGDITLGEVGAGRALVSPFDLVPGGTPATPAVVNIARLLQALDAVPGDDRISLPSHLHRVATLRNVAVAAAIESLNFADPDAFTNAASQLVSTLTADYPFTAMLVDAQVARTRLAAALAGATGAATP